VISAKAVVNSFNEHPFLNSVRSKCAIAFVDMTADALVLSKDAFRIVEDVSLIGFTVNDVLSNRLDESALFFEETRTTLSRAQRAFHAEFLNRDDAVHIVLPIVHRIETRIPQQRRRG
jgi:hypothetical protein